MKISPIMSAANVAPQPEGQPRVESLRSLKMNTNATPGYVTEAAQVPPENPSISDSNETKEVVEATQPLSPQFAELARQRRSLQRERRELEDKTKAFEAQSTGVDRVDLARLKSEPLSVLLEAGVTYDQLTEAILANQGNSEIHALKAEISALKEGVDKKLLDRDEQAEKQVLAEMQREALRLSSEGETYGLVRVTKSVPQVMGLIERTYKETGEVLEVSEALKLVEDELFKDAQKLAGLNKIKSHLTPPVTPQQQPGIRTLTNKHTASISMDRKQRALMAALGTLKR